MDQRTRERRLTGDLTDQTVFVGEIAGSHGDGRALGLIANGTDAEVLL